MRKILSLAVLTVFCIAAAGGVFVMDAQAAEKEIKAESKKKLEEGKFCNACEKGMKGLIIAHAASDCPVTAASIGVACEAALALETEGAATIICAGISVVIDVVCTEAGGVDKFKEHADKYAKKICEKVKACK